MEIIKYKNQVFPFCKFLSKEEIDRIKILIGPFQWAEVKAFHNTQLLKAKSKNEPGIKLIFFCEDAGEYWITYPQGMYKELRKPKKEEAPRTEETV